MPSIPAPRTALEWGPTHPALRTALDGEADRDGLCDRCVLSLARCCAMCRSSCCSAVRPLTAGPVGPDGSPRAPAGPRALAGERLPGRTGVIQPGVATVRLPRRLTRLCRDGTADNLSNGVYNPLQTSYVRLTSARIRGGSESGRGCGPVCRLSKGARARSAAAAGRHGAGANPSVTLPWVGLNPRSG